jgi:hypothetical protein
MEGLKPSGRVSLNTGHPWRFYGPALVLVTSPVFDAAKRYTESTPLASGELARDLAIVVLVALAAVLAAALLPGRHRMKGAVFTLTLLVGTGYPALAAAAGVGPCTWADTALGLSFLACVATVTVLWLRRAPKVLESLNGALWLTAGISLLISSQTAWAQFATTPAATDRSNLGGVRVELSPDAPAPDIIHIIVDGMGRLDELHDVYGIDSTETTRTLGGLGFRINDSAVANYAQTYLAVSSMLSMDYLDQAAPLATSEQDRTLTDAIIAQATVIRALKARGYRFSLFSNGYQALVEHPLADDGVMGPTLLSEFEAYVLQGTIFRILPVRAQTFVPHRERTRAVLSALGDYAPGPRPRFVLAHVLLPHPPFVFDAEGRDVVPPRLFTLSDGSQFSGDAEEFRAGYAAQARFVLATLEKLLRRWSALPRPPIVIVNGDHGSGLGFNMRSPIGSNTSGRMRLFLGVKGLDDTAALPGSPVNIYRTLFNQKFGTTLPILPDRSYVSSWPRPYAWTEVHVGAR